MSRAVFALPLTLALAGCWPGGASGEWQVTSETITPGKAASPRHSGRAGFSPGFVYPQATPFTQSVSVVIEDLEGKDGRPFVHWMVADLAPKGYFLEAEVLSMARVGQNGEGKNAFVPLPLTDPPHKMRVTFYAVDKRTGLEAGFTHEQLMTALKGHIEAEKKIDFLSPIK